MKQRREKEGWRRGGRVKEGNESIKKLSSVRCPNRGPTARRGAAAAGAGGRRTGKLRAANYIAFKINY